jgi:thiol-disulfide isomerase/thioredoxin
MTVRRVNLVLIHQRRAHVSCKQVREAGSPEDFEALLKDKPLVFVELYGTKCRKCYALMGKYSQLASSYESEKVAFIKVACDQVQGVAAKAGVSKTPTFQVYVHGQKVDELVSPPSPCMHACHASDLPLSFLHTRSKACWHHSLPKHVWCCLCLRCRGEQDRPRKSQNKSNRWSCSGRRRVVRRALVGPRCKGVKVLKRALKWVLVRNLVRMPVWAGAGMTHFLLLLRGHMENAAMKVVR